MLGKPAEQQVGGRVGAFEWDRMTSPTSELESRSGYPAGKRDTIRRGNRRIGAPVEDEGRSPDSVQRSATAETGGGEAL